MFCSVGTYVKRAAYELIKQVHAGLKDEDIDDLRGKGPALIEEAKSNLSRGKHPLFEMDNNDIRLLLAYVVYLRQNITTGNKDRPNDEDAAAILHKDVYGGTDKKTKEKMETETLMQLQKAGLPIKIVVKDDKNKEQ